MAKMLPPQYDESTRSSAERRLFDRLKSDPATENWIVLHSLGLSERAGKPYGEIDFVVIVPGSGIVCLEVKGGRVACKNGVWSSTDRHGQTDIMKRSPFMQAREGMFALRESLESHFGSQDDVMRCTLAYAVVFPDVDAPPASIEHEPWEVVDRTMLHRPVSQLVHRILRDQHRKLGARVNSSFPDAEMAAAIRQYLRPDFEVIVTRSTQILRLEEKLIQLTERQYDVLDRLHENPRCLIKGAAGTGKTLLAVEYAKRSALMGARVLLVCYNRLLGDWLDEQTRDFSSVTAGTYHNHLWQIILSSSFAPDFRREEGKTKTARFFDEVFPVYAELAVTELNEPYDVVVLDEAQDLLHPPVLNVVNVLLRGGLAGGRWAFMGDFTQQAIFSSPCDWTKDALDDYCPYYTRERLTVNCRNTRQIAQETLLLSGFPSPPFRLSKVEGLPVTYSYWYNARSQRQKLEQIIAGYLSDGLDPNDILLLSPVVFERSVASDVDRNARYHIQDVRQLSRARDDRMSILFATVQAYKGLESPVVILCDVSSIDDSEPQSLIYVGMSRARTHLTVLLHDDVRTSVAKLTTRKLLES